MKLLFKLLILLNLQSAFARDILIFTYSQESKSVEYLKKKLLKTLPKRMLTFEKKTSPCKDEYPNSILHLCYDKDLNVIRQNKDVLKRTIALLAKKGCVSVRNRDTTYRKN